MRLDDIIKIEDLYLLKNTHRYEVQLIEGLKKDVYWLSLSDIEKLDFRTKELTKKIIFKESYSDSIILYEESIIKLNKLIIEFLDEISSFVFNNENMSEQEFAFFRLKNMIYIELFALNKRLNLKYSGHVLFEEVMEPIFNELENTTFYLQYKLEDLRETYKKVSDLYKNDPYQKH